MLPSGCARSKSGLLEVKGQLARAMSQNDRLASTLREARERIAALREEVEKLSSPPSGYGLVLDTNEDGTIDVFTGGRKMRVERHPDLDEDLTKGTEVVLNESLNVVMARPAPSRRDRSCRSSKFSAPAAASSADAPTKNGWLLIGDGLRDDPAALRRRRPGRCRLRGRPREVCPAPRSSTSLLEDVPDVSYDDIGGLATQIEAITDAVELPFLHADLFLEHELPTAQGHPAVRPTWLRQDHDRQGGCELARAPRSRPSAPRTSDEEVRSYFFNIKGPELLNKYVGETERQIRLVFQRAREKSEEGWPVIVFFDEMESLFRTRGTGVSSDVESTIVPQLLAEIDGVETLNNVIVIGASNREDLIDPAILRPGRLDVKIKIERPDVDAAHAIFLALPDQRLADRT